MQHVVKGAVEFPAKICLGLWLPVLRETPAGAGTDAWKSFWLLGVAGPVPLEAGAALLVELSKMRVGKGWDCSL